MNILDCPCELFCPHGCTGCDNPVCQDVTTSSKPDTTTSPTASAVLILSNSRSEKPLIIDFDGQLIFWYINVRWFSGNTNENPSFKYEDGTTAFRGCGATLNGEFWYFGGEDKYKNVSLSSINFKIYNLCFSIFQTVSKIVGCQLVKQSDMAFDLSHPACNTFLEPTPKVLLCFPHEDVQGCHS